jgi:hypothetical protein
MLADVWAVGIATCAGLAVWFPNRKYSEAAPGNCQGVSAHAWGFKGLQLHTNTV